MKLPSRRILRSIVQDAISDREGFNDPAIADETATTIASYEAFLLRLANNALPLTDQDRKLLAKACRHARIWRESYLDSWLHTGEKQIILEARQDIDRVTRTEEALGIVHEEYTGPWITLEELRNGSPEIWDASAQSADSLVR